jgi:hypothetical protein
LSETGSGATPEESPPILPLTAKTVLQICWSLTLILSYEEQQNKLGDTFETYFMKVFQQYDNTAEKKDDEAAKQGSPKDAGGLRSTSGPSSESGPEKAEKRSPAIPAKVPDMGDHLARQHDNPKRMVEPAFVQNLVMSLAKNVRNIGFVRENHVRYLNFMSDELGQTIQFYDEIADFASTSNSSIITKLISFLGVGSTVDLATKGGGLTPLDVAIFTVSGLIGAALVTILLKYFRNGKIQTEYQKIREKQDEYWRKNFKMDMASQLFIQYSEFVELVERYYPDRYEQIKKNDALLSMDSEEEVWGARKYGVLGSMGC